MDEGIYFFFPMQQLGAHEGIHPAGGIAGICGAQHPIGAHDG